MKAENLKIGTIYKSLGGDVQSYEGIDIYCGQMTFKFRRLSDGVCNHIKYEDIESFITSKD